jgi:hypothetical protein
MAITEPRDATGQRPAARGRPGQSGQSGQPPTTTATKAPQP